MTFITRFKSWATGKAGNSVLKEQSVASSPSVAVLGAQLKQRFENLDRSLEKRYSLRDITAKNHESVCQINELVDSINEHILNAPPILSRAAVPVDSSVSDHGGEKILFERRSFERIIDTVPDTDGVMIIQGDYVVKVNNTLYDALCDTDKVAERFKSGNISVYHLFPKEVVNDIRKIFISRTQLNTDIQYAYQDTTFTLSLSEFVKDGLYYHKIQIRNLREALQPRTE